ncbi:Rpr2-domain-containing protein [Delitschia confertaspora ATCC 74209]|uniref:Rpr2-domain-containing protein n=1 Tax=Delitschia confertaspora ATCC 74209 TaxID=1513339 RepID=A0A9P4MTI1_9PLEO|nr:Rpr2-domain-containing protein [Delitschia confertaspora ATCC 74209]
MAKGNSGKGAKGLPNKHLHARASFLYQAATYLSLQTYSGAAASEKSHAGRIPSGDQDNPGIAEAPRRSTLPAHSCHANRSHSALGLQLSSHLRAVSLKGQIRLSPEMKRSICKSCNTVLIPGHTSTSRIENTSRKGTKPWADVLVIQCHFCGSQKRFPVGSARQPRKPMRTSVKAKQTTTAMASQDAEEELTPNSETDTNHHDLG